MEPVDRTDEQLRGLVTDLDAKLGTESTSPVATETPTSRRAAAGRGLRMAILFVAVIAVVSGLATVVVQPWKERCSYSADVCRVQSLDIDAWRVTIPDSELLGQLPNIDALDPDDELTAADIFNMDRFADLDVEALLSREEIDLLLQYVE